MNIYTHKALLDEEIFHLYLGVSSMSKDLNSFIILIEIAFCIVENKYKNLGLGYNIIPIDFYRLYL